MIASQGSRFHDRYRNDCTVCVVSGVSFGAMIKFSACICTRQGFPSQSNNEYQVGGGGLGRRKKTTAQAARINNPKIIALDLRSGRRPGEAPPGVDRLWINAAVIVPPAVIIATMTETCPVGPRSFHQPAASIVAPQKSRLSEFKGAK